MGTMRGHDHLEIGRIGESVAADFLTRRGFTIIERNYRRVYGEVDIIARKDGTVRFVEVKTVTRSIDQDSLHEKGKYRPEEMVHAFKLRQISRVAETYIMAKKIDQDFQIDVVTVRLDMNTRRAHCELFERVV